MKNKMQYEILESLGKFQRGKISVELNLVKWGFTKPTYDLRPWQQDEQNEGERIPWKGITFSNKGELRELRNILNALPLEDEDEAPKAV